MSDLVTLRVDGRLVATKEVEVGAGESELVTFERSFDRRGDHAIAVAGTEFPALTVAEADESVATATPTPATAQVVAATDSATAVPGAVNVAAASGLADWVREGYDAAVTVTLVNRGNRTATRAVPVAVDGRRVAAETVRIGPNDRQRVSIAFPAAEGVVSVAGVEVGRLAVRESPGPRPTTANADGAPTSGSGPGFGIAAVTVAACIFALRVTRGRRPD